MLLRILKFKIIKKKGMLNPYLISINDEAACLPGSSKWKQSLPKQQQHLLLTNKQYTAAPGSRSRQPLGAEQPVAARTRRRDTVTLGKFFFYI